MDAVVVMRMDPTALLEKLTGRRVCDGCGRGYNIADIRRDGLVMPPMLPKNGKVRIKALPIVKK